MKKVFAILAILMMALTAQAEIVTVTYNRSTDGEYLNKDGVTCPGRDFDVASNGTFTTASGVFTKIEITGGSTKSFDEFGGSGWSGSGTKRTWTGSASNVSWSGTICGDYGLTIVFTIDRPSTVDVTGVTLSQTLASMTVGGETLTLTATVAPDDATDKTVTWASSDAAVATVADGVVTAVGAGTATITVTATNGTAGDTSDDKTATCTVTVSPAKYAVTVKDGTEDATNRTITPSTATAGETVTVTYSGSLLPAEGRGRRGQGVPHGLRRR